MSISCSDSVHRDKRDKSTQRRHHIREDKKGTHNKAEKHGAIRTRPLFQIPVLSFRYPSHVRTDKILACSHKQKFPLQKKSSERGNRWCSSFSRSRSRPILVIVAPRTPTRIRVTVPKGVCFAHEGSFPASSLHNLPPQRSPHCTRGTPALDCWCLGKSSAVLGSV